MGTPIVKLIQEREEKKEEARQVAKEKAKAGTFVKVPDGKAWSNDDITALATHQKEKSAEGREAAKRAKVEARKAAQEAKKASKGKAAKGQKAKKSANQPHEGEAAAAVTEAALPSLVTKTILLCIDFY